MAKTDVRALTVEDGKGRGKWRHPGSSSIGKPLECGIGDNVRSGIWRERVPDVCLILSTNLG